MIEIDTFARQVLKNCEISDAQHAGLFSICGLALRLRDDHIKGTSHRKVKCDLLQVVCRNN